MERPYIPRLVDDHRLTTLQAFITLHNLLERDGKPMAPSTLLAYKDPKTGRSNQDNIRALYTESEKKSGRLDGQEANHLRMGTELMVPAWAWGKEYISTQGTFVHKSDDYAGLPQDYLGRMVGAKRYRLGPARGGITRLVPGVEVWAWCKALGSAPDKDGKLTGGLFNLTPFVESLSTQVGENGGNFTLTLPPLTVSGTLDLLTEAQLHLHQAGEAGGMAQYVAQAHLNYTGADDTLRRSRFLFHELLQAQDLVFISYEPLAGEERPLRSQLQLRLAEGTLARDSRGRERLFDMIGLVDHNAQSMDPSAPQVSITVSGRDLFKVVLDDGEYFFPAEYAGVDVTGAFRNQSDSPQARGSRPLRRLDGKLNALFAYADRSVEQTLQFIFGQLSHLAVAPDDLFLSWGEQRSKYFYPTKRDAQGLPEAVEETLGAGIYQLIKVVVDESIRGRRIADSSIAFNQGSLVNFIRKVCDPPFAEFFGDTYGNQYYFVARRPPWSRRDVRQQLAITDQLEGFHLREEDIFNEQLQFDDEQAYSWYTLEPKGNFLGSQSQTRLAYLPSVFFPEFAEVFGNKSWQKVTNYIDYLGLVRNRSDLDVKYLEQQGLADLQWVIQTHAALPFTRKGTLVVRADRRYRRGMWIRHLGTKEVFYIESVGQSYSVSTSGTERQTVLTVSRGMVDAYDERGRSILDRYFYLVSFDEQAPRTGAQGKPSPLVAEPEQAQPFEYDSSLPFPQREPELEYPHLAYGTEPGDQAEKLRPIRARHQAAANLALDQLAQRLRKDPNAEILLRVYRADYEPQTLAQDRANWLRATLAERLVSPQLPAAEQQRTRRQALARIQAVGLAPRTSGQRCQVTSQLTPGPAPDPRQLRPDATGRYWHVVHRHFAYFLQRRQFAAAAG